MSQVSLVADLLALVAFTVAAIVLYAIPTGPGSFYSRGAKAFSIAACAVYAVVTLTDLLDAFGVGALLESVESYVELLWAPFVLFAIYSLLARQQLNDAEVSRQRAVHARDVARRIMETAPAGIVMLDGDGQVTFSNRTARRLLDLEEDPESGAIRPPTWTMRLSEHGEASSEPVEGFSPLVGADALTDAHMIVEWPTGWRRRLSVNTVRVASSNEQRSGTVAAFIEREPWLSRPR